MPFFGLFGSPDVDSFEAKRDVKRLVKALKHRKSWVRYTAAHALGRVGAVQAVEPLIAALKDNDSTVREAAASALGELYDTRAIKPLLATLQDGNVQVRYNAAHALSYLKLNEDTGTIETLIAAMLVNTRGVSYEIGKVLASIGNAAVEPLIAALKVRNDDAKIEVINTLGVIGDTRALMPLMAVLTDTSNSACRDRASTALVAMGGIAVEPLIATLQHKDAKVRNSAVNALGDIGDRRAVEPLIAALKDEDTFSNVRYALEEIGDLRAVMPLLDTLQLGDDWQRQRVMDNLSKIGERNKTPSIEILMQLSTRNDLLLPSIEKMLAEAKSNLQTEGENGSLVLALLTIDLLDSRSKDIGWALDAAQQAIPAPELLFAIQMVISAEPLKNGKRGRFVPEIFSHEQIGWTDGTYKRIQDSANRALAALSKPK